MNSVEIPTRCLGVVIPVYNEEKTIVDTMKDFFNVCPETGIYLIDHTFLNHTNELLRCYLSGSRLLSPEMHYPPESPASARTSASNGA